jgi:hypothetical protein
MPPGGGGHGGPPGGGWQPPGGPPPGGFGPPPGGHGGPPGYGPPPGGFGGGFAPPPGGVPPQFGAPPGQGAGFTATEPWGFGWNVVIKRFGSVALPIALGGLIASIPAGIIYGAMIVMMQVVGSEIDPDMIGVVAGAGAGLAGLVLLLTMIYMAGGFVTLSLKAARGQPTGFGDLFSGGRFMGRFFVAAIVGSIVIGIGYALCLIPGYILAFGLSLTSFLIVDQDLSGVDALKRSWEMTKGHKVSIFLFQLVGIFVMLAGELACLLGLILVSIPMMVIGQAYIYLRIKGESPQAPT